MNPEQPVVNNSARNLIIFGIVAIVLAVISAGVSLFIYSATGDIYLDRSRPGFIADGETNSDDDEANQDNVFSPDGTVTSEDLDEYLEKLDAITREISSDPEVFSDVDLSDEALNITGSAE